MPQATFRFYEELNDFLPSNKRKTEFLFSFRGTPSIKDAIESIGIPHVEVDMIVVNGTPVDFCYKLRNEDRISVYPVFESLNISGVSPLRSKPLRNTKFILDVHLGRLCRYLRLCGFDSWFDMDIDDRMIVELSLKERRIILTHDRGLLKNKKVTHGYWIRSQNPAQQLNEVLQRFDLKNNMDPFTRCMECNGLLKSVLKEDILSKLLPMTIDNYHDFKKCSSCGKIYWEGSHYQKMKKFIETL